MTAPRLSMAFFALLFASTLCYAAEPEFTRSLTVNGNLTFSVCSTSGSIHVAGVDGNKVQIDAKLHNSTWHTTGTSGDMKEIVATPPIKQTGNEIKVGDADTCGGAKAHNIDIDYEITVPEKLHSRSRDWAGQHQGGKYWRLRSCGNRQREHRSRKHRTGFQVSHSWRHHRYHGCSWRPDGYHWIWKFDGWRFDRNRSQTTHLLGKHYDHKPSRRHADQLRHGQPDDRRAAKRRLEARNRIGKYSDSR